MSDPGIQRLIARLVPEGARVLDLGCGDGALLDLLQRERGCTGYGVEIADGNVLQCVRRGVDVIQLNLDEGLAMFDDASFDVVLQIEEFADDATLAALGIADPFELSGLYRGRPIGEKSISDNGALPDMITLYRRALLDEWVATGETLEALVTHVLVHEVGHHFGLSDDDMHALEDAPDP